MAVLAEALIVSYRQRTRSHQAHVALQHINQLGQLIDARLPQELPYRSNARVIFDFEHGSTDLIELFETRHIVFGIHDHGSELVDGEPSLILTDSLL